jgi:hypothetical protein
MPSSPRARSSGGPLRLIFRVVHVVTSAPALRSAPSHCSRASVQHGRMLRRELLARHVDSPAAGPHCAQHRVTRTTPELRAARPEARRTTAAVDRKRWFRVGLVPCSLTAGDRCAAILAAVPVSHVVAQTPLQSVKSGAHRNSHILACVGHPPLAQIPNLEVHAEL